MQPRARPDSGGCAPPRITVIVPTTCERARWSGLQRALASIAGQQDVDVEVLAVVNGQRYDPDCLAALRAMAGVTVLYRSEASAPLAQLAGREHLARPFFAFLDDDDEYLPGALAIRVAPLLEDATLDLVVTNGYRAIVGGDEPAVDDAGAVRADPLLALCAQNWMASCAGLYRASSFPPACFADPAPYMEWTYLAFRLLAQRSMRFLDVPTFRIHDTPRSLSKSAAYLRSEIAILEKILTLPLAPPVARAIGRKLGRAHHEACEDSRLAGEPRRAWRHYRACLRRPGGWRFLLYSRKLARDWLRAGR